jgi:type II restriction enzyme
MNHLDLYKRFFNKNTLEGIVKHFQNTLLESNMTYSYFCNWEKIKQNIDKYRYEINILNYIVGQNNPKEKLKEILRKNPKTLQVIPLIIAVRDLNIAVIEDPEKPIETLKKYDFGKASLSDTEITEILSFCEHSCILDLFSEIKNLNDFLLGVETGLDTNARKNRSGTAMELLIYPILKKIKDIEIYSQKKFGYVADLNKIKINDGLRSRKFDYVIKTPKKYFNVEVNYYAGQGSKPQEIVDSYINRNNELNGSGWGFIWISDGPGWKKGINQLTKAFSQMDYVLNVSFAKSGILEKILLL